MIPGDHVYYDESGAAIPLATPDTYAPLTTITKMEGKQHTHTHTHHSMLVFPPTY